MKKAVLLFLVLCGTTLMAQDWQPNWEVATKTSETTNKPILLVFSGSDWCAPCIKLDRDIWSTQVFQAFAKDHLVLYKADFPRRKANQLPEPLATQNKQLAAQFNAKGYFPLVVMLSTKKEVLGQTAYLNISPEEYTNKLKAMAANE